MDKFLLMNKNIVVAEITMTQSPVKQTYISNIEKQNLLPISVRNGISVEKWIDNRLILSHRKNVKQLFSSIGINGDSDILRVTKGISLNDTFWIKDVNSNTVWESVSPYTNSLNKTIADFSFNSRQVGGKNITHSPEFATSGNFPKCWKRMNGAIYLIKGGSTGHRMAGNEPFSEIHASILADMLGMNHVKYEYIRYQNVDATKCVNICNEKIGIYPLNEAMPALNDYDLILDKVRKTSDKELANILDMFLLDFLSLNTDRHLGNISVLVNNDTQELLGIAPTYDNNLAFLPTYSQTYDKSIDNYIGELRLSTNSGMSFEDLFKLIDCKYTREKVKQLYGRKIQSKYYRCDVANDVLLRQLKLAQKIHK